MYTKCFDMHIFEIYAILITFTLFTICRANYLTKNIYLQDYGNYPVNWDDDFLILYVTLINDGDIPVVASVKMIKCCEQLFTSNDIDCNHLQFDGSRKQLEGASNTNCTLTYPNAYPYNRKGKCNVDITIYINQNKVSRYLQDIPFDTTKKPEDIFSLQESMLNFDINFKLCESPDEDPLDLCTPVNCHMKYQGFRSLFDAIKRQCISIPICNRRLNNENSSNIVYDPYSNNCIALTDKISITDIDCILNETEDKKKCKNKKTKFLYQSNIRCHHGKMDEINRSCICDDGWASTLNWNFPIVSTVPVYMCTIQIQSTNIRKLLFMINNLESKNFYWALILSLAWYFIIQLIISCTVMMLEPTAAI